MKYIVTHNNEPKPHLCSVHAETCPEIQAKSKKSGFFKKEFDSLRDAWNYIKDNEWESEICAHCFPMAAMM